MSGPARHRQRQLVLLTAVVVSSIAACEPSGAPIPRTNTEPPSAEDVVPRRALNKRGQDGPQFFPTSVAFWDERRGLIAGGLKTSDCQAVLSCQYAVQLTTDGGETWRMVKRGAEREVSLATFGENRAWLSVSGCRKDRPCSSGLWTTRDGGQRWKRVSTRHVIEPSFAGRTGWAVKSHSKYPEPGVLAVTSNGGRSWSRLGSPCPREWHETVGVSASSRQEAWVFCASEGATYMMGKAVVGTTDGGATWEVRAAVPTGPWSHPFPNDGLSNGGHASGIFFSRGGAGWLWGGRGYFQLTGNEGSTWVRAGHRAVEPDALSIFDLWFVSPERGFALINTGRLMATSSGGRAWRSVMKFP